MRRSPYRVKVDVHQLPNREEQRIRRTVPLYRSGKERALTNPGNGQMRGFTLARVVALILIALSILGLAYSRFTSGAARVSVPARAHAGDLTLHACNYPTEKGNYPADCGTLVVPENRTNP